MAEQPKTKSRSIVKWSLFVLLATYVALELSVVVRDYIDPEWRDRYSVSYNYSC